MKKIVITAGGTGGHLIPAQMLAKKLKEKSYTITFMGHGLSNNYNFQRDFFSYVDITSSNINKKKLFSSFLKIFKGTFKSLYLFLRNRPKIVIGFGSYHSFSTMLASNILNIPTLVFESNLSLGKVNKFFAKRAKKVAFLYQNKKVNLKNIELVNPFFFNFKHIENKEENLLEKFNFKKEKFTILVFGGSNGSSFINEKFLLACEEIKKQGISFQVIHLCGKGQNIDMIKKCYEKNKIDYFLSLYEKNMSRLYAIADLVICRAGAATITELIYYKIPSILIPYPYAMQNHQDENALFMEKIVKGSFSFFQKDFNLKNFVEKILQISKKDEEYLHLKRNLNLYRENIEKEKRSFLDEIVQKLIVR